MNNLVSLAHAPHAEVPEFNAIFYATVATIIPLLFVTAALQQDMYAKLIDASRAAYRRFGASHALREQFRVLIIFLVAGLFPMLILAYGVIGEVVVLVDLYLQRTIGLGGPFNGALGPLIAAAALTIAVGLGPATKFVPLIYEVYGPSQAKKNAEIPPKEEAHGQGTTTGERSPDSDRPGGDQT